MINHTFKQLLIGIPIYGHTFLSFYFYFSLIMGVGFFVLFTIKGCFNKSLHFGRKVGSFCTSCSMKFLASSGIYFGYTILVLSTYIIILDYADNFLFYLFAFFALKGYSASQQLKGEHAYTPHVHSDVVILPL